MPEVLRLSETEVGRQLLLAGAAPYLARIEFQGETVRAIAVPGLVAVLRANDRFIEGLLHGLHGDVGPNRTDFRSIRGSFGKGSLQIVLDPLTGVFYADVDRFSPYDDVVGFVGHAGEVIRGWWRRLVTH